MIGTVIPGVVVALGGAAAPGVVGPAVAGGGTFVVVFVVFVAALAVLAVVTLRWAVRRDRAGRAQWVERQSAASAEGSVASAGTARSNGHAPRKPAPSPRKPAPSPQEPVPAPSPRPPKPAPAPRRPGRQGGPGQPRNARTRQPRGPGTTR